jgi:hypothetical protein
MFVRCVCGKGTNLPENTKGKRYACPNCGAGLSADGVRPWAHLPEDSIEERKGKGKPVILRRPVVRR